MDPFDFDVLIAGAGLKTPVTASIEASFMFSVDSNQALIERYKQLPSLGKPPTDTLLGVAGTISGIGVYNDHLEILSNDLAPAADGCKPRLIFTKEEGWRLRYDRPNRPDDGIPKTTYSKGTLHLL